MGFKRAVQHQTNSFSALALHYHIELNSEEDSVAKSYIKRKSEGHVMPIKAA